MIPKRDSGFRFYTLAIVLEDKKECSYMVRCWPLEDLPYTDGKVKDYKLKHFTVLPDLLGKVDSSAKHIAKSEMWAKWVNIGSTNRSTAPDVVANETIAILRYQDTEHYYWTTVYWDKKHRDFRKDEHVKHIYTNVKTPMTVKNDDNTYWEIMSTKKKLLRLHTSENDGEYTTYDMSLDTKKGIWCWVDGIGQIIQIHSPEKAIKFKALEKIEMETPLLNVLGRIVSHKDILSKEGMKTLGNFEALGSLLVNGCCCTCPKPPSLPPPPKVVCELKRPTCIPHEP